MKKTLILFFVFLFSFFLSFISIGYGASIVKDSTQDFTVSGSLFEKTTAKVEAGSVVLALSGGEALWVTDGVSVCAAAGNQWHPQLTSDGQGGAIITWRDRRGADDDIYAQKIDGSANVKWDSNDVAICTAVDHQRNTLLVSDGQGGAIITWEDTREADYDIYARRVNSNGIVEWTTNGVTISAAANNQWFPQLISDGQGGAIFAWRDERGTDYDIYAQRIDASGSIQWFTNGVTICAAADDQYSPQLISDGKGGAIIAWRDKRGAADDIYAQRIDSAGNFKWTTGGVTVCAATGIQVSPQLVSDGQGGAIIVWEDNRNSIGWYIYDIYAQRIDSNGNVQWPPDDVAICTAADSQWGPQLISDGQGGAIITWNDERDYRTKGTDIYAQRIDISGSARWIPGNGVAVCTRTDDQIYPQLISDGKGGAIITWQDFRPGNYSDIYAQKIDVNGGVRWAPGDGVAICDAADDQDDPQIISDGQDGAIIIWEDYRDWATTKSDIYAQRIDDVYFSSGKYTTEKIENTDSQFGGWTNLSWSGSGTIAAEVKTAASLGGLDSVNWTSVSSGGDIPNRDNKSYRWIQTRMSFIPSDFNTVTPRLDSLSLNFTTTPTPEVPPEEPPEEPPVVTPEVTVEGVLYGPNPFNPTIDVFDIYYQLDQEKDVKIRIYNLKGELVWEKFYAVGSEGARVNLLNKVPWDGKNNRGDIVKNGTYLLYIVAGKSVRRGKIIVSR